MHSAFRSLSRICRTPASLQHIFVSAANSSTLAVSPCPRFRCLNNFTLFTHSSGLSRSAISRHHHPRPHAIHFQTTVLLVTLILDSNPPACLLLYTSFGHSTHLPLCISHAYTSTLHSDNLPALRPPTRQTPQLVPCNINDRTSKLPLSLRSPANPTLPSTFIYTSFLC